QPFLTADEQHLYWTSDRNGYFQIYRAARLGENEWGPAELAVSGPPVGSPSLTDDGGTLCFAALVPAHLIPELGGNEADVYCAEAVD
ncbi:MAG: PD40 domain-containing protein, partial [Deltaproteobacteria bacterium]|nr:PD40 domain-containing protein [Deltaproteobacteria bacterium]